MEIYRIFLKIKIWHFKGFINFKKINSLSTEKQFDRQKIFAKKFRPDKITTSSFFLQKKMKDGRWIISKFRKGTKFHFLAQKFQILLFCIEN